MVQFVCSSCATAHSVFARFDSPWEGTIMRAGPRNEPRYVRVKHAIESMIDSGGLRGGEVIPGERVLAEGLSAAPGTVRRAMKELAAEGRVVRKPRVGTVVSSPVGCGAEQWAVAVPGMDYFYPPLVASVVTWIGGSTRWSLSTTARAWRC